MRLAAVQFKGIKGDKSASLARLAQLTAAAASNADLVVLPEMAATRYIYPDKAAVAQVAEPADGQTLAAMSPIAREHACWMVVGFPERDADRFFNSALVIDPTGELSFVYRKTMLYVDDLPWATPGDSGYRAFDTDWGRFSTGICMDINDDGFTTWLAANDIDVLAFPTNWVEEFSRVWNYWRRRLRPDITLVAANTYGLDRHAWFSGRSLISQAGVPLAHAGWLGDAVIRATVPTQ